MERTIAPGFEIPPASLQSVISLAVLVFLPIYDRVIVPFARAFTGKPSGITMLQRVGTGMFLAVLSMVFAALVEIKRLQTAREYDLVDSPGVTVPMSVWWLLPQYLLSGISNVFAMVGLQEFFYDQVPIELRSIGLSLYLSIFGVGSFLSSFLISIIEEATGGDGNDSCNQRELRLRQRRISVEAMLEFRGEGGSTSGFNRGRGAVTGLLQGGERSARLIGGDEDRAATESFSNKEWGVAMDTIPFGGEGRMGSGRVPTRWRA
ncbi:hypothetical protein TIFTF001_051717 [Ficus carica]|uniref:Uncharacterized protein n=1 Tax=Ficus carica TaxID=3494 RepID=A0AA88CTL9_FICCA|nr:hypothetical protein TIFTF001_051717 [Ficus carica]